MLDVVIVGAGVAGCRTAELAAKKGLKVAVLEEHDDVGKPVQCAGLVSHRLKGMLPNLPGEIFLNEVRRAKFFYGFESKPKFELQSKNPVHVINREKLDKELFSRARAEGASAFRSTKFLSHSVKESLVLKTTKESLESKLLVGADGPNSLVAKRSGMTIPQNHLVGVQVNVDGGFEPDAVEMWFGSDVAPGFFAWLIPTSASSARLGIATKTRALEHFKKFSKFRVGKEVKPDVGGMINFGIADTVADNAMVVGDAACQVKPFSGGGIVYSLIGASYCANACVKSVQSDDFSAAFLRKEYDDKWKRQLEGPIKKGLALRKMMFCSEKSTGFIMNASRLFRPLLEKFDMDFL